MCIPVFLFLFVIYYSGLGLDGGHVAKRDSISVLHGGVLGPVLCRRNGQDGPAENTFLDPTRLAAILPAPATSSWPSTRRDQAGEWWARRIGTWEEIFRGRDAGGTGVFLPGDGFWAPCTIRRPTGSSPSNRSRRDSSSLAGPASSSSDLEKRTGGESTARGRRAVRSRCLSIQGTDHGDQPHRHLPLRGDRHARAPSLQCLGHRPGTPRRLRPVRPEARIFARAKMAATFRRRHEPCQRRHSPSIPTANWLSWGSGGGGTRTRSAGELDLETGQGSGPRVCRFADRRGSQADGRVRVFAEPAAASPRATRLKKRTGLAQTSGTGQTAERGSIAQDGRHRSPSSSTIKRSGFTTWSTAGPDLRADQRPGRRFSRHFFDQGISSLVADGFGRVAALRDRNRSSPASLRGPAETLEMGLPIPSSCRFTRSFPSRTN